MTVPTKLVILEQGIISSNIFLNNYQVSRVLLQAINIVHVIVTLVSAKQVYNGKVKLFNEIEPFHL